MHTQYFQNTTAISDNLFAGTTPPDAATLDAMLNDPYYGLSSPGNYFRWNQLRPIGNTNVTEFNMKLAWQ